MYFCPKREPEELPDWRCEAGSENAKTKKSSPYGQGGKAKRDSAPGVGTTAGDKT